MGIVMLLDAAAAAAAFAGVPTILNFKPDRY